MSSKRDRGVADRSWLRIGLLFLAATSLSSGLWALFLPRPFYEGFPLPGWDWVSTLGPYNEHLVSDYGALNLALGVLMVAAAFFLERRLVQASLVAWLAYAVPHFVFHLGQTHRFSPFDNVAQLSALGFVVLLPLVLLFLTNVALQEGKRASQKDADPRTGERSVSS
jgi:hypothetical protein